jgi:predicted nucleic acid-binding protein
VSRLRYLVDTSVLSRLATPTVSAAFAPLATAGQIGICPPVAFELGYHARSGRDHAALTEELRLYPPIDVTAADHRRGLEVQALLAQRGQQRALSLVDALVAAAAEARDLTVLHYDSDFELVADVTGQAQEWIVPRGTVD